MVLVASNSGLARAATRWAVLAASGESAARAAVEARGLQAPLVLDKAQLLLPPHRLRALTRRAGVDGALLHSADWARQPNPQLYELALALMPVPTRFLLDERAGDRPRRLGRTWGARIAGRLPADAASAAAAVMGEAARFAIERRRSAPAPTSPPLGGADAPWIVAIWPGSAGGFGGSITHISGILGAFRRAGFRVALATCTPPTGQLQAAVDEVAVVPEIPPGRRVNGDVEHIACNTLLRRAGTDLARRLGAAFVYQRHAPFLTAGATIARARGIPLVLEWNSSEVWIRRNWQTQYAVERLVDPLLAAMERHVVAQATLVSAVSREAARVAFEAGASPSKTLVIPNAVDIAAIDRSLDGAAVRAVNGSVTLGWAGSFGPWHGAEVVVKALALLPDEIRLVMVGDGVERASCLALAQSLGVDRRIEWTGPLAHPLAVGTLARCDLLISPHTPLGDGQPFFGSPTKLFEYMAIGRPIVASALGQIGEVLEDRVTARLVTPGDVSELAGAIAEVVRMPDRGRHLGDAARREAVTHHTWDERVAALVGRLGRSA
jgi:glycosyltransferase involved in cell wall biosynthesis